MTKTQPTLTLSQVASLMETSEKLKTTFAGIPPTDVADIVSLFLRGHVTHETAAGGSKGDQLIKMLSRSKGATLDEVIDTFGIKKNSAYARISVETRRRGLTVTHEDGRYKVAA